MVTGGWPGMGWNGWTSWALADCKTNNDRIRVNVDKVIDSDDTITIEKPQESYDRPINQPITNRPTDRPTKRQTTIVSRFSWRRTLEAYVGRTEDKKLKKKN